MQEPTLREEPRQLLSKHDLVVVVGDWVIDEYWLQVRHHSRISSHTGFVHYRIESRPKTEILDLCGAGHVMRILAQAFEGDGTRPHLLGLGNWHQDDQEELLHLLHARNNSSCNANKALFRQRRIFCKSPPKDLTLYSLTPDGSTTCVIRQYHRQSGGIQQISRIDWELRPNRQKPPRDLGALDVREPDGEVLIAVNDLRKGVVTDALVAELVKRYPKASWCVRTKNIRQADPWLQSIKDRLVLHVIGPEVAAKLNPWNSWIANDRPTLQALETIDALHGQNVFLLSDQHEVVARLQSGDCLILRSQTKHDVTSQLGWSAATFAALVNAVSRHGGALTEAHVREAIKHADSEAGLPLTLHPVVEEPFSRKTTWTTEVAEWRLARSKFGLLRGGDELDVWRGSALLPGYIACVRKKEDIIRRIGALLRSFKRSTERPASLSILLQADPGAGKTFLAKSLARTFGFEFRPYDITQMLHREDLLALFDDIASRQANDPNALLLVFVDEINAQIDNSHAYGSFLTPLEEGYYVRRGNRFALRPCVWLFAGTDPQKAGLRKSDKYSDFESRMTAVERLDFASLQAAYRHNSATLQSEARLDQVYVGVLSILKLYPDVTRISQAVLEQFYNLNPAGSPARKIRRMCEALRDVQYGMVSKRNCDNWRDVSWQHSPKKFILINS